MVILCLCIFDWLCFVGVYIFIFIVILLWCYKWMYMFCLFYENNKCIDLLNLYELCFVKFIKESMFIVMI